MSKLVDTSLGQFRLVEDCGNKRFLFECPNCHEYLPLSESALEGNQVIDHESRIFAGRFCSFSGTREFGKTLIAAMQAQMLMGYRPYYDEVESA